LSDAGAEAIGLNQGSDEGANVVDAGAVHKISQSLDARLAGAHFEIDQVKFVAEIGMGVVEILANS
jgi:hypothetical protein